jgi:RNA-binding protein YhbY
VEKSIPTENFWCDLTQSLYILNMRAALQLTLLTVLCLEFSRGFVFQPSARQAMAVCCRSQSASGTIVLRDAGDAEDYEIDEEDFDESLFKEPKKNLDQMEKAWRHAQKPLLRIGSKGATLTHGNSLRQLLDAHTVVRVKVNTRRFGTLKEAFKQIAELAIESGAPEGIEMLQAREVDKVILFGLPGTLDKINKNEFPPPEPVVQDDIVRP